jgi:thiol-disulfide isomerase/thioredoxin
MKNIIILFFTIIFLNCETIGENEEINIKISSKGEKMVVGKISYKKLVDFSKKWKNSDQTNLNLKNDSKLRSLFFNIKIKIFMGTWCEDSIREIPYLFNILNSINYNIESVEIICVDENKNTPEGYEKDFEIIKVPTIIFFKKNEEINRIVEFPVETLQKDIIKILSNNNYKHAYSE